MSQITFPVDPPAQTTDNEWCKQAHVWMTISNHFAAWACVFAETIQEGDQARATELNNLTGAVAPSRQAVAPSLSTRTPSSHKA